MLRQTPLVMVVLDGAGDRPSRAYGGVTPLEAARTPNLDRLSRRGRLGLMYPVGRGFAPESHVAAFALLGYNPADVRLSRGVVEALGAGIDYMDGDLAFRCDFAAASEGMVVDRRAGRTLTLEESLSLANALTRNLKLPNGVSFILKPTIGHRGVVVFKGRSVEFSDRVSNVDPVYERVGNVSVARSDVALPVKIPLCRALSPSSKASSTARLVNLFVREAMNFLDGHKINRRRRSRGHLPANLLLLRDAGISRPRVPSVPERLGLKGKLIADMPVELGIAKIVGLETIKFEPKHGQRGYKDRARKVIELTAKYNLVFVHLKGPDEPGHDGDFTRKTKVLEEIDKGFFSMLSRSDIFGRALVCITSDHATPCSLKSHSDDPVPLLLLSRRHKPDHFPRFTERHAARGSLGIIEHGWEVIPLIRGDSHS